MDMFVEFQDTIFRVVTQAFSLDLHDTPANRQVAVVILRGMRDGGEQSLFTLQQLAQVVESDNRQAAGQHLEDFRACGEDVEQFLRRKRKVDVAVVEAVRAEVVRDPLVETTELGRRVQGQLGRVDLSVANIEAALAQVSCVELRRVLRGQLEVGAVQYTEARLLETLMQACADGGKVPAGIEVPVREESRLVDPTAIRTLLTPGAALEAVPEGVRWVVWGLTLYYWGVPLSCLGRWLGVHKTTVLRWMLGLVWVVWPTVAGWLVERVRPTVVLVDEKWLKIRRRWHYWFVVLDAGTGLPICTSLTEHRSEAVCRWLGVQLQLLGYRIRAVVHDGLAAYGALLPEAVHQRCLFHWQQGVTRWVTEHLGTTEEAEARKQVMKRVVQTSDTRTVRRRLAHLVTQVESWGIGEWVTQTTSQLAHLLPAMGSPRIPTTTNEIERFFRAFMRFYKGRGGFHSVRSAQWELLLFLVGYLFTQRATDGHAPIEAIVPEAAQMPLYRLINDPLGRLGGCMDVKYTPEMAGGLVHARLAA